MSNQDSGKTVFLAMSVNLFIGVIKTSVAIITKSSAMFSESIHSFVDSFNQFLLWFGIKESKKGISKIYPLGRGREQYFWTLVVAILIFTIGGLLSLQHGIEAISHPKKLENLNISIIILLISIILESYVLVKAVTKLKISDNSKSVFELIQISNDGPLIAIIVEDFAATLGLFFALIGTLLSYFTNDPIFDAYASIAIGILLMVSGLFLGYEMKHLIVGESVDTKTFNSVRKVIKDNTFITKILDLKIISIGSNSFMCIAEVDYKNTLIDVEIVRISKEIEQDIKKLDERFVNIFLIPA